MKIHQSLILSATRSASMKIVPPDTVAIPTWSIRLEKDAGTQCLEPYAFQQALGSKGIFATTLIARLGICAWWERPAANVVDKSVSRFATICVRRD